MYFFISSPFFNISALLDLSQASPPQNFNHIGQGTGISFACLYPHAIAPRFPCLQERILNSSTLLLHCILLFNPQQYVLTTLMGNMRAD